MKTTAKSDAILPFPVSWGADKEGERYETDEGFLAKCSCQIRAVDGVENLARRLSEGMNKCLRGREKNCVREGG